MGQLLDGEVTSIIHTISMIYEWLDQGLRERLMHVEDGDVTSNYAPSFRCLNAAGGSLPITQLAERMHRSKPYVTYMVNQMQKNGYFTRSKDEIDRRVNYVNLTEKGQRVAEEIDVIVSEITAEKLSIFTNEECQLLAILLDKVAHAF